MEAGAGECVPVSLEQLSEELVLMVLSFLPARDITTVSGVSRIFHRLANDASLWSSLFTGFVMAPHSHVILPRWVLLDRIQYYLHQTREVADGVSERPTCRVCQSLTCRFVYPKALAEIKEEISKTVMRRELDKDYALIHPGWEKDEGSVCLTPKDPFPTIGTALYLNEAVPGAGMLKYRIGTTVLCIAVAMNGLLSTQQLERQLNIQVASGLEDSVRFIIDKDPLVSPKDISEYFCKNFLVSDPKKRRAEAYFLTRGDHDHEWLMDRPLWVLTILADKRVQKLKNVKLTSLHHARRDLHHG